MVKHPLVDPRPAGDAVDPRPGESLARKLPQRRFQNARLGLPRIPDRQQRLRCPVGFHRSLDVRRVKVTVKLLADATERWGVYLPSRDGGPRCKSGADAPQSRRSASADAPAKARSVWTAALQRRFRIR